MLTPCTILGSGAYTEAILFQVLPLFPAMIARSRWSTVSADRRAKTLAACALAAQTQGSIAIVTTDPGVSEAAVVIVLLVRLVPLLTAISSATAWHIAVSYVATVALCNASIVPKQTTAKLTCCAHEATAA